MLHKGNIKISNGLKLFYLSQKSVIAAIFFSLFVIFAVIPFLNYSAYKELGMNDMLKDALINTARAYVYLPFREAFGVDLFVRRFCVFIDRRFVYILRPPF